MLIRLLICFNLLCLATEARAQSSIVFGRYGHDYFGTSVIPAPDGGFWVGGNGTDSSSQNQLWLARFDSHGAMVFDSIYGDPQMPLGDVREAWLNDMAVDSAGYMMVVGRSRRRSDYAATALSLRLDQEGNVVSRSYPSYQHNKFYNAAEEGIAVAALPMNGFWQAGTVTDDKTRYTGAYVGLQKDTRETASFWPDLRLFRQNSAAAGLAVTQAGNPFLVGTVDTLGGSALFTERYDPIKDTTIRKVYLGFTATRAISVRRTRDNEFVIAGNGNSPWMMVLDSMAEVIFRRAYTDQKIVHSVIQTSDGGYALLGSQSGRAQLKKLNEMGEEEWTRSYSEGTSTIGYDLFERQGVLVLVGDAAVDGTQKLWVQYTDLKGDPAIYPTVMPASVAVEEVDPSLLSISPSVISASSEEPVNLRSSHPIEQVQIYNSQSQCVLSERYSPALLRATFTMPKSSPLGHYFVRVRSATGTGQTRLLLH